MSHTNPYMPPALGESGGQLVAQVFSRAKASLPPTSSAGGLVNWTEGLSNTGINTPRYAINFAVSNGSSADIDAVIVPKGLGAFQLAVADGTTTGGNKRGANAVDIQSLRTAATQVAAANSVCIGVKNTSSPQGFAGGEGCNAGVSSVAIGYINQATGTGSVAIGGYGANSFYLNATGLCAAIIGGHGQGSAGGGANAAYSGILAGVYQSITAAGTAAAIVGGSSHVVSGAYSATLGGFSCTVDGDYSVMHGYQGAGRTSIYGYTHSAIAFSTNGDNQLQRHMMSASTTDATQTRMTADRGAATAINTLVLPDNSAYVVTGQVMGRQNSTGDATAWTFTCLIRRGAGVGTTAMVVACTPTLVGADAGAATWALAVDADTTLGGLRVRVTGQAAKTIRWSGSTESNQVGG